MPPPPLGRIERPYELTLHEAHGEWRCAVWHDHGVMDGTLGHDDLTPDEAQALLLERVESLTDQRYDAEWRQTDPGSWAATLTPAATAG